jgi:ATP-dependent Clp endopeptidase proteolytic subunit ClpP
MNNILPFPKAKKEWFSLKNSSEDSADVFIYDVVGDSWEGNDAASVVKEINALNAKTINLRINSPGGSVFDGMAIFNALINHPAKVVTHIDGAALSIASVIALAGNEINMAENAMFMIHNPWTFTAGDAKSLRKEADVLDQVTQTIINTYESRTGQDRENLAEAMSEETWYTADEALAAGFITQVNKASKIAACADSETLKTLGFLRIPENLSPAPSEPENNSTSSTPAILLQRKLALREKELTLNS